MSALPVPDQDKALILARSEKMCRQRSIQGEDDGMRTEIRKQIDRGFFMSESELRRIAETLKDQFGKPPCGTAVEVQCKVTFQNGGFSEDVTVDQVLELENGGSAAIRGLTIQAHSDGEKPAYAVDLDFAAAPSSEDSSIAYRVRGDDRDWAFVTASLLEERLTRVRRFPFSAFTRGRNGMMLGLLASVALLYSSLVILVISAGNRYKPIEMVLDSLRSEQSLPGLQNPTAALIRLEAVKTRVYSQPTVINIFAWPLVVCASIVAILYAIAKARPSYTYYWGEAVPSYDRRTKIGNFVIVVIVLGLALSVIGSYIASRLGF